MRKTFLVVGFLFAFVVTGYSETEIFEGYDGMKWGTTVDEFLEKYPNAVDVSSLFPMGKATVTFKVNDSRTGIRLYRFYKNEFFMAAISYKYTSPTAVDAVIEKFIDTYGPFDANNYEKDANEECVFKSFSASFYVELNYKRLITIRIMNSAVFDEAREAAVEERKNDIDM